MPVSRVDVVLAERKEEGKESLCALHLDVHPRMVVQTPQVF